ncbi:unnamed protein product, partial [Staurois parvus]
CVHDCYRGGIGVQCSEVGRGQGRTDNSWGPRAIVDHGARVLAQTQKSL